MSKFLISICLIIVANADFYKSRMEGWFAYKDANLTKDGNASKKLEQKKVKKEIEIPNLNNLSAKEFEELMNESKGIAAMNPTKSNVKKLIILQNFMHKKADAMTDTWEDVMLENPELDMSVNIAKTSFARNAQTLTNKEDKKNFFDKYSKFLTLVLFYDNNKKEVTSSQDNVFDFISYTYPSMKLLKIDVNNQKATELFEKLKINKNITPDIWIMIDKDGKQKWKRVAVGLSTQDKIVDKIYKYGNQLFNDGGNK